MYAPDSFFCEKGGGGGGLGWGLGESSRSLEKNAVGLLRR